MRVFLAFLFLFASACRGDPAQGPLEEACARTCKEKLTQCDEGSCVRGCRLSLDRMAENESAAVFDCMGRGKSCDEHAFARCAARIGPHADGGPPLPPKKEEDD